MVGYGSALAVALGAFTYTGGKLSGYQRDPEVDEVSRKEYLRKNRRRPIDQIANEIGEGRGAVIPETSWCPRLTDDLSRYLRARIPGAETTAHKRRLWHRGNAFVNL